MKILVCGCVEVVHASGAEEPNSDMTSAFGHALHPTLRLAGEGLASLARPTVHIAKIIVNFDVNFDINSDRYSSIEVVDAR